MCCRRTTNRRIISLFNMVMATLTAVLAGAILGLFGLPCWLISGVVAVTAVLTEHYLTLYPLAILKYITLPIKEDE